MWKYVIIIICLNHKEQVKAAILRQWNNETLGFWYQYVLLFEGNLNVCDFVSFLDEDYCSEMLTIMNRMSYCEVYVVKHSYFKYDVLMTIIDKYMFRPLLAIFKLPSTELKVLLFILCTHLLERTLHPGFVA
jgi:hypothetical protein